MDQQLGGAHGFESSDADDDHSTLEHELSDADDGSLESTEDEEVTSDHNFLESDEEEEAQNFSPPSPRPSQVADEDADYVTDSDEECNDDDDDAQADQAIYDRHVETVREFEQPCPNLRTHGWATEFTFRTAQDDNVIEDVGEMLQAVLRQLIRDAKANAVRAGYRGGWIGVGWQSEIMETTFVIPYGSDVHNNARKIITAFEGWDQSAKENDLYGQVLRVQVH